MNAQGQGRAEILIIDADPVSLTGTAAVLEMAGNICHCAQDRIAALRAGRTIALDLIICDVQVGADSGLELCRELRRLPGMQDVPVMFVSASQVPDIVRRSHDAGGAYYLRKPFDPDVLVELVSKALWMPHLVRSRLMHEPSSQPVPAPATKRAIIDAVSGIRIPMA